MAEKKALTPRQRRAIAAVLAARSVPEAAEVANVGERTLYRWLRQADFMAELHQAEAQLVGDAARGLLAELQNNHKTLRQVRDDDTLPASVRVRAADLLDQAALRWRQAGDLETRITELERLAYDPKNTA